MLKRILIPVAIVASTLISGCKSELAVAVKSTDLVGEDKRVQMVAQFEIPSCNSYEDSRVESDTLIQLKASIADMFPDSEFVECFTQKFVTVARFSMPVSLDLENDSHIAPTPLALETYTSDGITYISTYLSSKLKAQINSKKNSMTAGIGDISLGLFMANLSESPIKFGGDNVYVRLPDENEDVGDPIPTISFDVDIPSQSFVMVELSDVANDYLLSGDNEKINAPVAWVKLPTPAEQ